MSLSRYLNGLLGKKRLLHLTSCVTAIVAIFLLLSAISMDSWLFTVEREALDNGNGSYLIMLHSGLWRVCKKQIFLEGVVKMTQWNTSWLIHDHHADNCSRIVYIQRSKRQAGELKPTESITYDMRPAAFFPLSGLLLLLIGYGMAFLSRCRYRTPRLVFIGGGFNIVSGILTLIGIVIYVGSVSQAFDAISGPITVETRYVYSYGAAFQLCICAFILSEFSGVFSVYLVLAKMRHQNKYKGFHLLSKEYVSKHPTSFAHGEYFSAISTVGFASTSPIVTARTSIAQMSFSAKTSSMSINSLKERTLNSSTGRCILSIFKQDRKKVDRSAPEMSNTGKKQLIQMNNISQASRAKVVSYSGLDIEKQPSFTRSMQSLKYDRHPGSSDLCLQSSSEEFDQIRNAKIALAESFSPLQIAKSSKIGRNARSLANLRDDTREVQTKSGRSPVNHKNFNDEVIPVRRCRQCEALMNAQLNQPVRLSNPNTHTTSEDATYSFFSDTNSMSFCSYSFQDRSDRSNDCTLYIPTSPYICIHRTPKKNILESRKSGSCPATAKSGDNAYFLTENKSEQVTSFSKKISQAEKSSLDGQSRIIDVCQCRQIAENSNSSSGNLTTNSSEKQSEFFRLRSTATLSTPVKPESVNSLTQSYPKYSKKLRRRLKITAV